MLLATLGPKRAVANMTVGLGFRPFRGFLQHDLLEQSVAERLAWAAIAAGLLWLAIWWALS
jgi:hypothetical protein